MLFINVINKLEQRKLNFPYLQKKSKRFLKYFFNLLEKK